MISLLKYVKSGNDLQNLEIKSHEQANRDRTWWSPPVEVMEYLSFLGWPPECEESKSRLVRRAYYLAKGYTVKSLKDKDPIIRKCADSYFKLKKLINN